MMGRHLHVHITDSVGSPSMVRGYLCNAMFDYELSDRRFSKNKRMRLE